MVHLAHPVVLSDHCVVARTSWPIQTTSRCWGMAGDRVAAPSSQPGWTALGKVTEWGWSVLLPVTSLSRQVLVTAPAGRHPEAIDVLRRARQRHQRRPPSHAAGEHDRGERLRRRLRDLPGPAGDDHRTIEPDAERSGRSGIRDRVTTGSHAEVSPVTDTGPTERLHMLHAAELTPWSVRFSGPPRLALRDPYRGSVALLHSALLFAHLSQIGRPHAS